MKGCIKSHQRLIERKKRERERERKQTQPGKILKMCRKSNKRAIKGRSEREREKKVCAYVCEKIGVDIERQELIEIN